METQWWQWAVAGVALMLCEFAVPAFVLVWFGVGAMLVAVVVALGLETSMSLQLVLWLTGSVALVALWFRVVKPNRDKKRAGVEIKSPTSVQ